MRIVIAGQTYLPGNNGQAIFTIHLAEGLVKAGHEVHVITPGSRLQTETRVVNGVRVHLLRSMSVNWLHPGAYTPALAGSYVSQLLESVRPDVVHIQDHYFLCRSVARTAARLGLTVMGTNHFLPENVLPYLRPVPLSRNIKIVILWKLMLWTFSRLQIITTPTETAARILLRRSPRAPVLAVSCGVDTTCFRPDPHLDRPAACAQFGLDPEKVIFLYVGRLDREKRVDLLLRALALLKARGSGPAQLGIAGQGAAEAELRRLAGTLGLRQEARFLGYVPSESLPRLYQTADIFAMPSPEELQSIATLEAMASCRPVLAANARALPELVAPGLNGLLFEPGSVESAAAGMQALADARADWPRMGWASRLRAQAHSLESTIRRYEDIYRRLGGVKPRPAVQEKGLFAYFQKLFDI